jgi:periplasmic protein TonB
MNQTALALHEPLSPPRIGGVATAIAFHIVAFMLLMVPLSYTPPMIVDDEPVVIQDFTRVKPIEEPKPPPPIEVIKEKPRIVPLTQIRTITPPNVTPEVFYNTPTDNNIPYVPPTTGGPIVEPYVAPPSGPVSLSTEFAPAPRYPTISLRNGEEGTVILLVRVDAMGRPTEIDIQKSSGYKELDRAAKKHVLETWRFYPAMHQGSAIAALALVPVVFKISE